MPIEKDKVVSFNYRMYEGSEKLEDSWQENQPVLYLHGHGNMLTALEQAMDGKQSGDEINLTLTPEKAYGPVVPNSVERVPMKYLTPGSKPRVGKVISISTRNGPKEVVVVKVGRFNVDVDTNHPLAGKTLRFEIEIGEVRDAIAEELSHGHAHGVGGHDH